MVNSNDSYTREYEKFMRENAGNPDYLPERDSIDDLNTQVFTNSSYDPTSFSGPNSRVPQYNPYTSNGPNLYESVKTSVEKESEQVRMLS